MDAYACRKIIRSIDNCIKEGSEKFIIYPFGERGLYVKQVLKERYGIEPVAIIDNLLAGTNGIVSLEALKEKKLDDIKILLAHEYPVSCTEIRQNLLKYVNIKNIVDIFSPSMYFHDIYYEDLYYEDPRRMNLEKAMREIYRNNIPGEIAEFGVYEGDFAQWINLCFPEKKLYLFDTFSGFDDRDIDDFEMNLSAKRLSYGKFEGNANKREKLVLEKMSYDNVVHIKKGYFPDSTYDMEEIKYSFVHIDVDLYKPTKAGLEYFWPRMSPGGYIFCHDLQAAQFPGARIAIKEFCEENGASYVPMNDNLTGVLAKPFSKNCVKE